MGTNHEGFSLADWEKYKKIPRMNIIGQAINHALLAIDAPQAQAAAELQSRMLTQHPALEALYTLDPCWQNSCYFSLSSERIEFDWSGALTIPKKAWSFLFVFGDFDETIIELCADQKVLVKPGTILAIRGSAIDKLTISDARGGWRGILLYYTPLKVWDTFGVACI